MKKILLFTILLTFSFNSFSQLISTNHKIIDNKQKMIINLIDPSKRSATNPSSCNVDTVEYPRYKASAFFTVTVSQGRALGQLYNCPQSIDVRGFTFYGFAIPPTTNANRTVRVICRLYAAGSDSLPSGSPLRADTVTVDTVVGSTIQLQRIERHAKWASITLNVPYIITVETDSANVNTGIVTNSYSAGDGRREYLNCGSISGNWYKGRNLNINGIPFNCDIALYPHVKYSLGANFNIKNNCYNVSDSISLSNLSGSSVAGSSMYNRYMLFNLEYFCHWWNNGYNFGNTYSKDYKYKYPIKGNYNIQLISFCYGYRGNLNGCQDTTIKTIYFRPETPTISGLNNVCSGDTAKFTGNSNDAGMVYEWYDKSTDAIPFYTGNPYEKFPLTSNDTFFLRTNNNGCKSSARQLNLTVNNYPSYLNTKDDSICSGARANLTAYSDYGTIEWFDAPTGGNRVFTGSVYQTPILTNTTSYYVQASNNGCRYDNGNRKEVIANVGADFSPNPPIMSNDTTVCLTTAGILTFTAQAQSGLTIRWFDQASGGSSINTGNTYQYFSTQREVKTFYADAYNGICGSTRVPVKLTVENHPTISKIVQDSACLGKSVQLEATVPYGDINWYDAPSNGNLITTANVYIHSPSNTTTYYLETQSDICKSPSRTPIIATIFAPPTIIYALGDTICAKNPALLKGKITGDGNLNWFEFDTSSTPLFKGLNFTTPVLNGAKNFYVQPEYMGCAGQKRIVSSLVRPVPFSGFSYEILTWQQVRVSPISAPTSSILWKFGDGKTSTAGTVVHRYENTGTYNITLILTSIINGCKDSTTYPVDITTSNISKVSGNEKFEIYPNPTNSVLNIKSEKEIKNITIYNSLGQIIYQQDNSDNKNEVVYDLSSLSSGLYVLKINESFLFKIVRE